MSRKLGRLGGWQGVRKWAWISELSMSFWYGSLLRWPAALISSYKVVALHGYERSLACMHACMVAPDSSVRLNARRFVPLLETIR